MFQHMTKENLELIEYQEDPRKSMGFENAATQQLFPPTLSQRKKIETKTEKKLTTVFLYNLANKNCIID